MERLTPERLATAHSAIWVYGHRRSTLAEWEMDFMRKFVREFNEHGDRYLWKAHKWARLERIAAKR